MPLEISEIGVRLAVAPANPTPAPTESPAAAAPADPAALTPAKVDEIVSADVNQVLDELKSREAR